MYDRMLRRDAQGNVIPNPEIGSSAQAEEARRRQIAAQAEGFRTGQAGMMGPMKSPNVNLAQWAQMSGYGAPPAPSQPAIPQMNQLTPSGNPAPGSPVSPVRPTYPQQNQPVQVEGPSAPPPGMQTPTPENTQDVRMKNNRMANDAFRQYMLMFSGGRE